MGLGIVLGALAVSPSQRSLLAPWLGVSRWFYSMEAVVSVQTTSPEVCRGGWLANGKYTMFAFFLLTVPCN